MQDDELLLDQIELSCRVGTTPEERAFPQVLTASVRVILSLKEAGQADDLNKTVDYASLIEDLRSRIKSKTFHLIEAVAESLAAIVMERERVEAVQVKVEKKIFPGVRSVGATIYRARESGR